MSNTHGNFTVDLMQDFAAYERLPPLMRQVLRNSLADWAAAPFLGDALKHGADVLAQYHMQVDVDEARHDAAADWGEQAAEYLAAQRPRRIRDWMDPPPRRRAL